MPFKKNDPKTVQAAKLGGSTGQKHLQTMSKKKLRLLSTKAGKRSGESRRAAAQRKADEKAADKYQAKIMKNYLV